MPREPSPFNAQPPNGGHEPIGQAGSKIGGYVVEREIGRGGMGVVHLAVDPKLKRRVAIKALPTKHATDPLWRHRLAIEAERLAALNHPHIALIYERLDIEGEGCYLVMEYVEGRSLRALLERGPVGLSQTLALGAQVASALESAHNRGIIHRDIKPENIQVSNENVAKVLDFGVALEAPGRIDPEAPTRLGAISEASALAGTPGYMSPEQTRCRPVDRRTDIFAFGCILFECLSGTPAFGGETDADRMAATLEHEPDWDLLPPTTPDKVRDLIVHCLEKNLIDRLRDMADARYALESAAGRRQTPSKSRSPVPTPCNLPVRMQSFVGREEAVERLRGLIGATRLVTIGGAAGCGKTSVAIQVAASLLAEHPGGVWFIDLSGVEDSASVPETIAEVLGIGPGVGQRTLKAFDPLLGERAALLVMDNCEHLIPGIAGVVDGLLRTFPQSRILATSREVLGLPGEQVYFLPSLALPGDVSVGTDSETLQNEAVRLFVERARLVRPGFNPLGASLTAVARVCQSLDGIPLAIELAAARVKMLSPEQIEERLADRFQFLTGGAGDARHSTMRGALDWSYRLLSDEDRSALHHLEVFVGGWTLEAASWVLRMKDLVALDVLTRLVDKSLVVADVAAEQGSTDGTRFRLLESIREYLRRIRNDRQRFVTGRFELDWVPICDRHLEYFEQLASQSLEGLRTKDAEIWRRRVMSDRANFILAQRHVLGPYHGAERWTPFSSCLSQIWKLVFPDK